MFVLKFEVTTKQLFKENENFNINIYNIKSILSQEKNSLKAPKNMIQNRKREKGGANIVDLVDERPKLDYIKRKSSWRLGQYNLTSYSIHWLNNS